MVFRFILDVTREMLITGILRNICNTQKKGKERERESKGKHATLSFHFDPFWHAHAKQNVFSYIIFLESFSTLFTA